MRPPGETRTMARVSESLCGQPRPHRARAQVDKAQHRPEQCGAGTGRAQSLMVKRIRLRKENALTSRMIRLEELQHELRDRAVGGRIIVALAGPPGSGKSTLAEALVESLNADVPGCATVLPMDGFHYDDLYLTPAGLRPRKGAPDTFDVGGLRHTLLRLKSGMKSMSPFRSSIVSLRSRAPAQDSSPKRRRSSSSRETICSCERAPGPNLFAAVRRHCSHRDPSRCSARAADGEVAALQSHAGPDHRKARGQRSAERSAGHVGERRSGLSNRERLIARDPMNHERQFFKRLYSGRRTPRRKRVRARAKVIKRRKYVSAWLEQRFVVRRHRRGVG